MRRRARHRPEGQGIARTCLEFLQSETRATKRLKTGNNRRAFDSSGPAAQEARKHIRILYSESIWDGSRAVFNFAGQVHWTFSVRCTLLQRCGLESTQLSSNRDSPSVASPGTAGRPAPLRLRRPGRDSKRRRKPQRIHHDARWQTLMTRRDCRPHPRCDPSLRARVSDAPPANGPCRSRRRAHGAPARLRSYASPP